MTKNVTLRIILEHPTPGVEYGIQKGKGSNYETILKQKSNSEDVYFQFEVPVTIDDNRELNFTGPFCQGPAGERFIYIDIGTYAGQKNTPWSRRLKLPLKNISRNMIDKFQPGNVLLTTLPGTDPKDGGPTCGTIKLVDWKLVTGVLK